MNAKDWLQKKNIKITANRILILEVFLHTNYALSMADILEKLPWADKATVFRTLKTFEKNALIHIIDDGSKSGKYALCSDACEITSHRIHPHFHCEKCGKTICLTAQDVNIPKLADSFTVNTYSLVINGVCDICNRAIL
jgi:Fur family ferric uptake transcriptional regulator